MTTSLSKKPRGMILAFVLWMTGFFLVASVPYGAHAQQQNPGKTATFGYVTNGNDNTVSVIATHNNAVVATIPVGNFPTGVATTPDGTRAYVRNFGNTVSVIDTASKTVVATIPVGDQPFNVAITLDESRTNERDDRRHDPLAYVTNSADNTVSVIDTANNRVVATIRVGNFPFGVAFAMVTPSHHSSEH